MTKRVTLILIVALLVILQGLVVSPALAQVQGTGQLTVSNSNAQMDFPLTLNFSTQISSKSNVTDIRLRYIIEQMSFVQATSEAFVNFIPAAGVNAKWSLDMRKIGGIPPGTVIDYWWKVRDASGATIESSQSKFQVNDNRYKWQNLTQGKINLFWYQGDNSFAQSLMSAAQQSLDKLAKDTGASPERMINIYIYGSAQDLQGSMIYPQEWTGGVAFTQYNIIAIGISPSNLSWGQRAMTHELTHNVINQVIFNPYSGVPVWLNEGLAMFAEGPLTGQFTGPLDLAIANNTLISVRSLASPFSAYTEKSMLSYAESYSLVDYLTERFGSSKMLELLNTFKLGNTYDSALIKVFGFDMDGLDGQWKTWVTGK